VALRIVEAVGLTDVGRQRNTNEDAYLDSAPVFAVADGMGGARAGEVASRMALETFAAGRDPAASPERQLAAVAHAANQKIHEHAQRDRSRAGMGTTLTAAIVAGKEVALAHVGDSRAYRLSGGRLERLTNDHSLVEELVRQGRLTPAEAEVHPQRSVITRALGPEPDVEVETCTYPGQAGDVYLLCSDGLTGMVADDELAAILRTRSSLPQAARELVDLANANGGKDNITVVLFELAEDAASSAVEETTRPDEDTLPGSDGGLDAAGVRAALAAADERDRTGEQQPQQHERTFVRSAPARTSPPELRPRPVSDAQMPRRRAQLSAFLVALALTAVVVGAYVGSRQFFFVGADERGLVAIYRGLPYDLPFGLELYAKEYTSSVPAGAIPALRRRRVLDHQLRRRGDAADVVRQLELNRGRT